MKFYSRKQFIKKTTLGLTSMPFILTPSRTVGQQRPDPIKPEIVHEFVRKGHFDLDGVKQMLEEYPTLINASWDWGNGDFETALGGASHMGEKTIASFLIEKGARVDIFTGAMLGNLNIVTSIAENHPAALQSKGPHGITLLMHAKKGQSDSVIKFLNSKGIKQ